MTHSPLLKLNRAAKHIAELCELFRNTRPYVLAIETDIGTAKRRLFPKENGTAIDHAGTIAGDVVHNIRSALDHAYWQIVAPCVSAAELKRIQFPFAEKADGLDSAMQRRLAQNAGTGFYCAIRHLKPYANPGGNELLFLVHELDILDKHRLLIPTADHLELRSTDVRTFAPDFPFDLGGGVSFSSCAFQWQPSGPITQENLGSIKPPTFHIFERELEIPLDIVFRPWPAGPARPMVPTLNQMLDTARKTIQEIRAAAESY
jgi:hypothetical protein